MTLGENLNLIGRIGMAAYFIWATLFNIGAKGEHVAHFRALKLPFAELCFTAGMLAQFAGAVMLLFAPTVVIGGAMLIGFTLSADLIYHHFWLIKDDPKERTTQKLIVYEHIAFCGGLLGLISLHI